MRKLGARSSRPYRSVQWYRIPATVRDVQAPSAKLQRWEAPGINVTEPNAVLGLHGPLLLQPLALFRKQSSDVVSKHMTVRSCVYFTKLLRCLGVWTDDLRSQEALHQLQLFRTVSTSGTHVPTPAALVGLISLVLLCLCMYVCLCEEIIVKKYIFSRWLEARRHEDFTTYVWEERVERCRRAIVHQVPLQAAWRIAREGPFLLFTGGSSTTNAAFWAFHAQLTKASVDILPGRTAQTICR